MLLSSFFLKQELLCGLEKGLLDVRVRLHECTLGDDLAESQKKDLGAPRNIETPQGLHSTTIGLSHK